VKAEMKKYLKDRLLRNCIEVHKKIVTEGEDANLESFGFESGTPLDRVRTYNAFTILSKLGFEREEATTPSSDSAKYLDELAATEPNVEVIISKLVEYREQSVNS
jgi:hypothetical protein